MNRTPRNFGQSFSAASFVAGVVKVTEAVIIVVIIVGVGVTIMSKGLLLEFPGHSVLHMSIVMLNDIA